MSSNPQIECQQVQRLFPSPSGQVTGLEDISFQVQSGEFIAIQGPSGCGKSTLLLTLGGMLRPTQGRVLLAGQDIYALPASERTRLRARHIGFVFQLFHLIPYLSVRDNVLTGLAQANQKHVPGQDVDSLLDKLGLMPRAKHFPATLSAGERQRVALARALIKHPQVILADEPTGNLDPENAAGVFRHLGDFQKQGGTVIVVTHGQDARAHAQRTLYLRNGRLDASQNAVTETVTH